MTVETLTTCNESQTFDRKSVKIAAKDLASIVRLDNMRYVHFSRNPLIAKFLKAHKFVREFGEGIDRMYRELQEAGNPTPKYEQVAFMIVGTAYSLMYEGKGKAKESLGKKTTEKDLQKDLQNPIEKKSLTPLEAKIVGTLKKNPTYSQKQIADEIGVGFTTVREYVGKLKKKGLLTRVGPDKGGYWKVTEEKD